MTQILVCAHPWKLIQAQQTPFSGDPVPAIYGCPFCKSVKNEGDPDPRITIGRIEEDLKGDSK